MPQYDDLIDDDPNAQAIEADDEAYYEPYGEGSGVVVIEPEVISVGRGKRHVALRKMQEEQRQKGQ